MSVFVRLCWISVNKPLTEIKILSAFTYHHVIKKKAQEDILKNVGTTLEQKWPP